MPCGLCEAKWLGGASWVLLRCLSWQWSPLTEARCIQGCVTGKGAMLAEGQETWLSISTAILKRICLSYHCKWHLPLFFWGGVSFEFFVGPNCSCMSHSRCACKSSLCVCMHTYVHEWVLGCAIYYQRTGSLICKKMKCGRFSDWTFWQKDLSWFKMYERWNTMWWHILGHLCWDSAGSGALSAFCCRLLRGNDHCSRWQKWWCLPSSTLVYL